jgi:hypothetical protein
MRSGPALHEVPRRARRLRAQFEWSWAIVAVVAVSALLGVAPATRGGSFVEHVSVLNRSEFQVEVDVAKAGDDAWMGLGAARARETSVFDEGYDQCDEWVIRFSTPTRSFETRIKRADLERSQWKIEVPQPLVEQLRGAAV